MISVAKENFRELREEAAARAVTGDAGAALGAVGPTDGFRLTNPDDPTTAVVAPYVEEPERDHVGGDDSCATGGCGSQAPLQLSDEQLERIREAKLRAAQRVEKDNE